MKSFLLKLSGVTLIAAGGIFCAAKAAWLNGFESFSYTALVFLFLLTLLIYTILKMGFTIKDNSRFMAVFAVAIATKFLVSLLFLSYFIFIKPITNTNFIFPFFALYFLFTALLVWEITTTPKS
ncbi:MAG: hypothetical protein U0T73_13335 [Chitinophagales bacterium]